MTSPARQPVPSMTHKQPPMQSCQACNQGVQQKPLCTTKSPGSGCAWKASRATWTAPKLAVPHRKMRDLPGLEKRLHFARRRRAFFHNATRRVSSPAAWWLVSAPFGPQLFILTPAAFEPIRCPPTLLNPKQPPSRCGRRARGRNAGAHKSRSQPSISACRQTYHISISSQSQHRRRALGRARRRARA